MARRPALRALAERAGIESEYVAAGGARQRTSDATRVALLAALGHDASDERGARRALEALEAEERERGADPGPTAQRCPPPAVRLGRRRAFGLIANLYALRGAGGEGCGNLADLCALVRLAGDHGAAFVGINPLHALRNRPPEISPYAPLSRLFRNPLYLDLRSVPEWPHCAPARRRLAAAPAQRELAALRAAPRIDYARVAAFQAPLVAALHREFAARHAGRGTARGRAFAAFRARHDPLLADFAVFAALDEQPRRAGRPPDWRAWPARYRDPRGAALRAFAAAHREVVERHAYVQFELDRQLAAVAAEARRRGLAIGLYQDLALGSAASGFDPWAFPGLFVAGATVGAPPDAYNAAGQDWGFPPLHPRRLARDGSRFFRLLLRAALAHAGALRLDHVMGLFRLWWIPAGRPATEGAYVRYPGADLLGVLADESRRQGALVVGEDLGTLPRGLPAMLARRGVLSSRVLYFEREAGGGFRPARRYSRRALVTANTHDLPTLAAFWTGRDLTLLHELDLLEGGRELARARAARARERRALLRRLRAEGLLPQGGAEPALPEFCAAVHAFLCRTPAPLVGIALDDLAGETEPVNVPGVGPDRFPSWTRRMSRSLEELAAAPDLGSALAGTRSRRRPKAARS